MHTQRASPETKGRQKTAQVMGDVIFGGCWRKEGDEELAPNYSGGKRSLTWFGGRDEGWGRPAVQGMGCD